jgi:hypothetical protein
MLSFCDEKTLERHFSQGKFDRPASLKSTSNSRFIRFSQGQ